MIERDIGSLKVRMKVCPGWAVNPSMGNKSSAGFVLQSFGFQMNPASVKCSSVKALVKCKDFQVLALKAQFYIKAGGIFPATGKTRN